jgi:type II secretory pathway component PulK
MIAAPQREEGFASVTAVMLCAGLAMVAVALVNKGLDSARQADAEVTREQERQALRSALSEASAALVNVPDQRLGASTLDVDELKIEVTASNELGKINVWSASAGEIRSELGNLRIGNVELLPSEIVAARSRLPSEASFADLLSELKIDSSDAACLREKFTAHASSFDPVAASTGAGGPLDGAVLSLRARIVQGRPLDLTLIRTVVITGNASEPLLVLGERAVRTSQLQRCQHEAT